jgi:hypothetical protein
MCEEPERSKAIICAHYHQPRPRKRWPERIALAIACTIGSAMKEHDDRLLLPRRHSPGPDIQKEAVLVPMRVDQPALGELRTRRPELRSVVKARLSGDRLWWLPA